MRRIGGLCPYRPAGRRRSQLRRAQCSSRLRPWAAVFNDELRQGAALGIGAARIVEHLQSGAPETGAYVDQAIAAVLAARCTVKVTA